MSAARDIEDLLNDGRIELSQRFKLAQSFLKSARENSPEKPQILLNWICSCINSIQSRSDNVTDLKKWIFMHKVLHLKSCEIKFTRSFINILTFGMCQIVAGDEDISFYVFDCAQEALKNTTFLSVLNFNIYENFAMLAVTLKAVAEMKWRKLANLELAMKVVAEILVTFREICGKQLDQEKVFEVACSELLNSASNFAVAFSDSSTCLEAELYICYKKMMEDLFFNWSHLSAYEAMIQGTFGGKHEINANMNKFISCVRDSCTQSKDVVEHGKSERNSCLLIVVLYESFLERYTKFTPRTKVQFLVILLKVAGVDPNIKNNPVLPENLCSVVETSESERLEIICKLLRALSSKQTDLSVTVGSDLATMRFFKIIRDVLFTSFSTRPASWFESLNALLDINVAILKPAIKKTLTTSWLNVAEISVDAEKVQGKFLSHLVTTYTKLFQLPNFIEVLLSAYLENTGSRSTKLPVEVLNVFETGFEELPCGQILKVWDVLVSSLKDTLTVPRNGKGCAGFNITVPLLHSLILHTRLLELTLTPTDSKNFSDILNVTFDFCMPKLLHLSLSTKDKSVIFPFLLLSKALGDFSHFLVNYSPNYSKEISSKLNKFKTGKSHRDLEALHFHCKSSEWEDLFALIRTIDDPQLNCLAVSLVMQKVAACVSFGKLSKVQNVVDEAIEFVNSFGPFEINGNASWNCRAEDVNNSNVHVALWTTVALNLKHLVSNCSEKSLEILTRIIVDVISQNKNSGHKSTRKKRKCPFVEAETLMKWEEVTELPTLQTAIITHLLQKCCLLFSTSGNVILKSGSKLLKALSCDPKSWLEFRNTVPKSEDKIWESVKTASKILLENMKLGRDANSHVSDMSDYGKELSSLLRVVELLPLRHLLPVNNLRICYFAISVICSLETFGDGEKRIDFTKRCQKILISILDGQTRIFVFNFLPSSEVVDWMLRAFAHIDVKNEILIEEFYESSDDLLERTVKLIMQDNAYFKELDPCITKFSDQCCNTSRLHLAFVVAVLDGAQHVMNRIANMTPKKLNLFEKCFNSLRPILLAYTENFMEGRLASDHRMKSKILKGFGDILNHELQTKETLTTLERYLPSVMKEALDLMKLQKGGTSNLDLITVAVANYDKLDHCVPEKFIKTVWQNINGSLRNLYSNECAEDKMQIEESGNVENSISRLLEVVCTCCSADEFQKYILDSLIFSIDVPEYSENNLEIVNVSIRIWLIILKMQLDDAKWKKIKNISSEMFSTSRDLFTYIFGSEMSPLTRNVAVNSLKVLVTFLSSFPNDLSTHQLDLCLQNCMCCNLVNISDAQTFGLFFADIYEICNCVLMNHTRMIQEILPSFISFTNYILSALMRRSYQDKLEHSNEDANILHKCSLSMERLFTLMSTNKSVSSGAAHIIGKYVTELSKATLLPIIKATLTIGMQRLLSICNRQELILLQFNLKSGGRELFTQLYDDFIKYHKYQGKI